jgi:NADPH:quinone reductase-like Zn-dependent oxidoreductase
MKAAFIEQYGGPEVLKYGDLPDPVAGTGEVVIDVVAASVNAADWIRAGEYARHAQSKFPLIPGRDFAGVISAVGNGVVDLKIDDAVFGVCEAGQEGAYAEKIAVKAAIIAKKPEGLSHVNAAALALTGLTAISVVEETLKLQPGETILIQGGAGGVASFAIQFAKRGPRRPERGRQSDPLGPPTGRRRRFHFRENTDSGWGANAGARAFAAIAAAPASYGVIANPRHRKISGLGQR